MLPNQPGEIICDINIFIRHTVWYVYINRYAGLSQILENAYKIVVPSGYARARVKQICEPTRVLQ